MRNIEMPGMPGGKPGFLLLPSAAAERRHSAFRPAVFTTCAHFSISARRYLSNSAGDIASGTAPCLSQDSFTCGLLIALLISALSLSTIALGVPAGAMIPSQMVDS